LKSYRKTFFQKVFLKKTKGFSKKKGKKVIVFICLLWYNIKNERGKNERQEK